MLPPDTPARWRQQRAFALVWNPIEMRLQKSADSRVLEIGRPDLHERIELFLTLAYGPEWLRDTQGLTESEIQSEVVRLRTLASERRRRKRTVRQGDHP